MAVGSDAIWAVDLGNNSLKALHLVGVGDVVQVIGFDHIPHGKIVSSAGVSPTERAELIAITLRQFVQRNEIEYDPLIISVPSQNSFARFVTLPPVETKKIPEIVQFEAAQQIPFDISEVQWDYQLMSDPESPEKRVGIFAIKNEVVSSALEQFEREDLQVSYVQMAPMALYNYLLFDRADLVNSDKRATAVVNIGADTTDLVICTASNVWQRCIVMGGNAFTQAIADAFKLNPEKAEKLKRTAPVSKYARQIFQAMRPVFTDWASEVQRSIGFYTSSNPDVKIARVVAMGGGTRLRGLLKYLQQTLQIPVEKPDTFKRLALAPGLSSAKFHENVSDFGVVYGLGLQGLGMARIESNLLPTSVARSMAWAGKRKFFIGAAVLLLAVSLMCLGRVGWDRTVYARQRDTRVKAQRVVAQAQEIIQSKDNIGQKETSIQDQARKQFELFEYRDITARLHELLVSALPNAKNNPDQESLHEAFAAGDVAKVMAVPRNKREQLFITHMSIYFADNLATAQFNKTALMRRDQAQGMMGEESSLYDEAMMAELESIYGAEYMKQMMGGQTEQTTKESGFVVTIAGYSPYGQYENLLDPMGVENDRGKWGFVTRIEHLDQFLGLDPSRTPFELYSRQADHFLLEKGVVDPAQEMPAGVGEIQYVEDPANPQARTPGTMMGYGGIRTGKPILVDSMTREEIGAETILGPDGHPEVDATGKPKLRERDHWFALQFKLLWKKGDAAGQTSTGGV
ncbi:MAG: type IV pilus assembly protein PilM [Sedimentisphaerales bacterium]|nr:type IV pilus assembly protein PilM [Sedimentisphaerales bacterium]